MARNQSQFRSSLGIAVKQVIVVGGGAAGIMAAYRAATLKANVVLLEKTDRIGTKILISGGGKCNITHDGPIEDVIRAFRPNEGRFIRPACYKFPNVQIVKMFIDRGLEVYARPDGRIFPVSRTAKDVVAILESYLVAAGVKIIRNAAVSEISVDGDDLTVNTSEGKSYSGIVILATGGSSYPKTGSTGDGWKWARKLGHKIIPVKAALAPIDMEFTSPYTAGVALRDIVLRARAKKEISKWRGDLLFTHHGVSGPCALGVSREVAEIFPTQPVRLFVDLMPNCKEEPLQEWIREFVQSNPKKQLSSFPVPSLPESLRIAFFQTLKANAAKPGSQVSKKDIAIMAQELKQWDIGRVTGVPLTKGEVVAGGVSLDEVNYQTMASLKVKNLFLCGEVLDVAGPVGGYNLQAAFATGYLAGENAATISQLK